MATFQASDVRAGPTATAIAENVTQLQNTQEALADERQNVDATLTALAPGSAGPSDQSPSLGQAMSQKPGISAELVEFRRFENTVTVKAHFANSADEDQTINVTRNSYLLDEATRTKYGATEQSNAGALTIPAGGDIHVWAKYGITEGDDPQYLTVVLPDGILFEHIKVP